MLVLERKLGESVILTTPAGESIAVRIVQIRGSTIPQKVKVRIGITAPRSVCVLREELADHVADQSDS